MFSFSKGRPKVFVFVFYFTLAVQCLPESKYLRVPLKRVLFNVFSIFFKYICIYKKCFLRKWLTSALKIMVDTKHDETYVVSITQIYYVIFTLSNF